MPTPPRLPILLLLVSRLSERVEVEICSKKEVLVVKPLNSSHLFLKDLKSANKKYQEGCLGQNMTVNSLNVRVESHAVEQRAFELHIDTNGNVLIPVGSCFTHKIWLTATVGNENHSLRFCDIISEKLH